MPLSAPGVPASIPAPLAGAVSGSATVAAAFTLTGTGTKTASGSATISATFTLAGTGTAHAEGSATITVTVSLTGSGTKTTGIGSPRPQLRWQFVAGPASGGLETALADARDRKYTARLTDPDEISFTLDGRSAQAAAIAELSTDVHVLWTPPGGGPTRILSRGRVGSTSDDLDADTHKLQVQVLDYRAVLARMPLYSDSTLTYTSQDQSLIAWDLVQDTQTRTGGYLGIYRGIGQATGINRTVTYAAGDPIAQRINELAAQVIDGFDWAINTDGASALSFDVYYPARGQDRGVVLEYGGLVESVRRQVDPGEFGNAIRVTGADGLTAQELEATDLATRPEGRWGLVIGDDDLTTQAMLNNRAAWQILASQVLTPTYSLTLRPGGWEGPDHIWLGDTVQLVIMSGRLAVDTLLRVYEMAFTIDEDSGETIEVTVGGPKPDYRRKPRDVARRLSTLERR